MVAVTAVIILLATAVLVVLVRDEPIDLGTILGRPVETMAPEPTLALLAAVPTVLPTETPAKPLQPTWTPSGQQPSVTPAPINTRRPTLEPSITPTFPPATPTRTPTPTQTSTPTVTPTGPTPTATNTRSPFPFTKSNDSPFFLRNYANSAGCNWLGIAGEVLDLSGNPVPVASYQVHIWESGVDTRISVGSAQAYGPSGWEQFIFDAPVIRTYNLQLETPAGTPVSQVYQVQTRASCNENLLYMIFVQNH